MHKKAKTSNPPKGKAKVRELTLPARGKASHRHLS
jgi:hypothetical protein